MRQPRGHTPTVGTSSNAWRRIRTRARLQPCRGIDGGERDALETVFNEFAGAVKTTAWRVLGDDPLPTESLPALAVDRAYQLWVINDEGAVVSADLLGHTPAPSTFTWTGTVTGFALTREIAGGVVSSHGDVVSVISEA